MWAHIALCGGGGAYQADDVPGLDGLALLHRRLLLQAAVLRLIAVCVGDDHRDAHKVVIAYLLHRAGGGGLHRIALLGPNVYAVVGAPIGHGLIIHQLCHTEHRHRGAVQRGADLWQQLLRLQGLLHGLRVRLRHLGPLHVLHLLLAHNGLILALLRHLCLLHQDEIAGHTDGRQA